jgi:two-component system, cell cycle sensor histidine kinase and response regulator CckA
VDEPGEILPGKKVEGGAALQGRETILVVEDEEAVRELAVEFLKAQGYTVLEAPHGSAASLVCREYKGSIDLLLTDVVMPGMNGHALAGHLATLRPEMKVLYMSGYTDDAIEHHGVLEEGVNYIQKPFSLLGLSKKVREVLDKKKSS